MLTKIMLLKKMNINLYMLMIQYVLMLLLRLLFGFEFFNYVVVLLSCIICIIVLQIELAISKTDYNLTYKLLPQNYSKTVNKKLNALYYNTFFLFLICIQ